MKGKISRKTKRGGREKKPNGCTLSFYISFFGDQFLSDLKKTCLTEEVYYFGGNVKTRLDIEARLCGRIWNPNALSDVWKISQTQANLIKKKF